LDCRDRVGLFLWIAWEHEIANSKYRLMNLGVTQRRGMEGPLPGQI